MVALVMSGGVALGAYHAGAYAALHEAANLPPVRWVAGSSTGAAIAALIAGNPPERRIGQLQRFWQLAALNPFRMAPAMAMGRQRGAGRRAYSLASVLQTHLLGRPGMFRPRMLPDLGTPGLYDLSPLRAWLSELVDFDRLNDGDVRMTIAATDIETGERVAFDTRKGCRIGVDHILASCALTPMFPPVLMDGRLLGDGGLSSNTPLDLVLDEPRDSELVCFIIDLFERKGSRPTSVSDALARALDLVFGNQSQGLLDNQRQVHRLRADIQRLGALLSPEARAKPGIAEVLAGASSQPKLALYLGQRAALDEAGAGKIFDYSDVTLAERWQRGADHMQAALQKLEALAAEGFAPGLAVREV